MARQKKPVEGQPKNILLIRPDHLGDVLFLTPALRALRVAQPEAKITVLVGGWARDLLTLNPDVDELKRLIFLVQSQTKAGLAGPLQAITSRGERPEGALRYGHHLSL